MISIEIALRQQPEAMMNEISIAQLGTKVGQSKTARITAKLVAKRKKRRKNNE